MKRKFKHAYLGLELSEKDMKKLYEVDHPKHDITFDEYLRRCLKSGNFKEV